MSFFYNPSKAMKEVLESDRDIIERLTKENNELLEKQNTMEKYMDSLGIDDNFDGLLNFLKVLYENKDEFIEFLNMKKNNIPLCSCKDNIVSTIDIKKSNEYIELQEDNIKMKAHLDELNTKLNNLSENDNKIDIESIVKNTEEKYIEKIHKLEISNKELLKKLDTGIPTPSSSTENKENVKKEEDNILDLPKNLLEVIYNRNIENNYSYFKKNHKKYLRCCNTDYKNKEISSTNFITCSKCFRTFNLSSEADEKNIYKIFVKTLKEHIIKNEDELLKQVNCNTIGCNYISKKEIDFCYKCKNMEICIPIITKLPDKDKEGIETVKTFASETHNNMLFYKKVFETAKKEKINVYEMKPLVDFIKNNKLMKEKQPNIIIRKILRSIYILDLYNEDKYIKNQDIIKRIYINLDILAKLDDTQFTSFKNILINMLNKEIEKKGDTNIEDDTLEYSCKNGSCVDNVNIEYTFCNSCKNSLKKCEKCNEEFYTDEDNKYCEDCSDSDSDIDDYNNDE